MKLPASLISAPPECLRVFVLHWNRPAECVRTVGELGRQGVPVRITVIDNNSKPENLRALIDGLPASTDVLRLDANLGWGRALNEALRPWISEGPEELCAVCAHDAALEPRCLERVVAALHADARLGLACPQHGRPEVVEFSATKGVHLRHVPAGVDGDVVQMPAPHGTLSILRRRCLQEIGAFDERYFAYGDETEIGIRAARAGWRSGMVWGARVSNPGTSTPHRLRAYLLARNNILTVHLQFGAGAALGRAVVTLASCLKPFWWAQRNGLGLVAARARGTMDFFLRRFGQPPPKYFDRR